MQASDPSYGIQGELLRHLHLVSSFRYPIQAHVAPEEALNNLLQAPRIVNEMSPMAWTYFNQPPGDGQLFLSWQPPRMRGQFATDGYIWADPEAQFHQEIKGYTLEICVHRAGYALGRDHQVATHTRFRYHIINKIPSVQGPAFDPLLWLVHYGPNDPQARIPIDRIPVAPQIRQFMAERQYIEQQGGLQRKEFMLRDRLNWPQLSLGQRQQIPQMAVQPAAAAVGYGMNPMQARSAQQYYPAPTVQQPPAKRQRVNATQGHLSNAISAGQIPDLVIEEEEGAALGDYLDNLTPAEISKMRYKQHHEWMEEIYSSVFSISQIVPEELGLGLTGKLKDLTDGIFNTPNYDAMTAPFQQEKYAQKYRNTEDPLLRLRAKKERLLDTPPGSFQYKKLTPEKLEEFETRVTSFMESGREEIEAMKAKHAATVSEFKQSKAYMVGERKLRDADEATAENVVKDLENSLNVSIVEQKDVICVEEGGLEKEDKTLVNGSGAASGNTNGSASNFNGNGNSITFGDGDNSAADLLNQFGSGSYEGTPVGRIPTPQISQPHSAAQTPGATAGPSSEFIQHVEPDESGLDLIDGMDLDVDLGGLGEDVSGDLKPAGEDEWVLVNESGQPSGGEPNLETDPKPSAAPQPAHNPAPQPPTQNHLEEPVEASSSVQNQIAAEDTPGSATGMFNDADFGTFDNLDTAGDALADFATGSGDDDDFGLDLGDDEIQFGDTPTGEEKMQGDEVV